MIAAVAYGFGARSVVQVFLDTAYLRQDGLPPGTEPTLEATTTYEPGIDTGVFCYSTNVAVVAVHQVHSPPVWRGWK